MPMGSYWPNMTINVSIWRGNSKPSRWSNDDGYIYNRDSDWTQTGFKRSSYTTCREVMATTLRNFADSYSSVFKGKIPGFNYELELTVDKDIPSVEWMTMWRNAWVFPNLIRKVNLTSNGRYSFILSNDFAIAGCPEPVFSYSFFFYNRHEAFNIDHLADHDRMIKKLIKDGEAYWGSSGGFGTYALAHSFAVYLRSIGNDQSFYAMTKCNGIGQYILKTCLVQNLTEFSEYEKKFKPPLSNISSGLIGNGITPIILLNAFRAAQSTRSSW